jgi:hypothetical protein
VAGTTAKAGEPATTSAAKRTKVRLKRTRFGRVLFDSDAYALYLFTRDGRGSRCNDDPLGIVLCQDVREFGGVWYAVKRSEEPVR